MQPKCAVRPLYMLIAVVLLAVITITLSVGTTSARYSTAITQTQSFCAELAPSVYSYTDNDGGTYAFTPSWTEVIGSKQTSFIVTNVDADGNVADRDLTFRIIVFVPENSTYNTGNLEFAVKIGDSDVYYASVSDYLGTNTPLYYELQKKGYVYTFHKQGDNGNTDVASQLTATVCGGDASELKITLAVDTNTENETTVEYALENLSIIIDEM